MFEVAKISSPARSEPVLQFRFVTLERFHLGLNRTFWGFVRRVKLGLVLFVVKIKPTRSAAVRASGRPEVNLVGIARIECMEAARSVCTWPIAETAAAGRRVRLLGYCCHQRDMRRRDLHMLRCRYHETKRLSDPPDDAWQTCTGMGCDRSPSRAVARSTIQDNLGRARAAGIGRSCATARRLRARRGTWPHARSGGRDRLHRWVAADPSA